MGRTSNKRNQFSWHKSSLRSRRTRCRRFGICIGHSWNLPLDLCLECCGFDYDSAANPPMVSRLLGDTVSVDHLQRCRQDCISVRSLSMLLSLLLHIWYWLKLSLLTGIPARSVLSRETRWGAGRSRSKATWFSRATLWWTSFQLLSPLLLDSTQWSQIFARLNSRRDHVRRFDII